MILNPLFWAFFGITLKPETLGDVPVERLYVDLVKTSLINRYIEGCNLIFQLS
jgi:hypothetical protein